MPRVIAGRIGYALAALALAACNSTTTPTPPSGSAAPARSVMTQPPDTTVAPAPSGSAGPAIAQTDACTLLFPAEVATALGVDIQDAEAAPPVTDESGWRTDCRYWRHAFHDESLPMELTLATGDRYVGYFHDLQGQDRVSPVSGLGDEAVVRLVSIRGLPGPVAALFIRIGGTVVGLSLGIVGLSDTGDMQLAGDAPTQTRMLTGLAGLAIARLTGPPEVSAKTCELLGASEAGSIVGLPFADAEDVDPHDAWGPSCRYLDATGPNANEQWIDLWIAVSSGPAARAHFDACRAAGTIVPGLGDEAFDPNPGDVACQVKIGFNFQSNPLMVRTGDSVIAVGDWGGRPLDVPDRRERIVAVARALLAKLGGVSVTPPPVNADALEQPCALLSDQEVGRIVGATVTEHAEWKASEDLGVATCMYTGELHAAPLTFDLSRGEQALGKFNMEVKRASSFVPLPGLGDEAFYRGTVNETDQPLVTVFIRSGDLVLKIQFGPVRPAPDFLTYIAPGTVDQQIEMARTIAAKLLAQVLGS